jgi:hypothetical protein
MALSTVSKSQHNRAHASAPTKPTPAQRHSSSWFGTAMSNGDSQSAHGSLGVGLCDLPDDILRRHGTRHRSRKGQRTGGHRYDLLQTSFASGVQQFRASFPRPRMVAAGSGGRKGSSRTRYAENKHLCRKGRGQRSSGKKRTRLMS